MAANYKTTMQFLKSELMNIYKEPIEGFKVKLLSEENIFRWEVVIFGPPNTLYEGGYFKALMNFPPDYPYSPPSMKFLTTISHPNIFESGDICISILDPPCPDCRCSCNIERWNPTRNVRSVLLSVVSLLSEPNLSSPANMHVAELYQLWKDSKGTKKEYETIIREQVLATRDEAVKDGVKVPTTIEEYCTVAQQIQGIKQISEDKCEDLSAISDKEFLLYDRDDDDEGFSTDTDDDDEGFNDNNEN